MDGIIPLNKDRGMTSFDCVSKIRKIVHMKKVGHSGTLDPNVDGVLPICLGSGTKVVDFLMMSGKKYRGEITFGFSTTTEDLDGEVVDKQEIKEPFLDSEIQDKMHQLESPKLKQIPPMYSAVKVNGRRLYEYARAGEKVERPVRYVKVNEFKMTSKSEYNSKQKTQKFLFEVSCGKGTYVRTLAIMLGQLLEVPATMTSLTRIESGHFTLDQTCTLEQLKEAAKNNDLNKFIYPIDHALVDYPVHNLSEKEWKIVQNGGFLNLNKVAQQPSQVVLKYDRQAKALYQIKNEQYRPLKMFSNK